MSNQASLPSVYKGMHLVVVFVEHRRLGIIAKPYMANKEAGNPKISLVEQITLARAKDSNVPFSEIEMRIIKALDEISDQRLCKKYSKIATLKTFIDTFTADLFEKHIRPDIEKQLSKCIEFLALSGNIPAYYKSANYSQVYPDDQLLIPILPTQAVFYFDLQDQSLEYTLKVRDNGNDFGLLGRQIQLIAHDPCVFILNQKIYRFADIDSKKIQPFLDKNAISIPKASVKAYMERFVMNCISNYQVVANGFDIVCNDKSPNVKLGVEQDLHLQPVLALYFVYNNKPYIAGAPSQDAVEMSCHNDSYVFTKTERKLDFEKGIVQKLELLGLIHKNSNHFYLPNALTGESTVSIHNLITWLSKNKASIEILNIEIEQLFFDKKYILCEGEIIKEVVEEADWFDLKILLKINDYLIPFYKLKKHIVSRTPEFVLPDGSIYIIPQEYFTRFSDLLHFAKVSDNDSLQIDRVHFNLVEQSLGITLKLIDSLAQSLNLNLNSISQPKNINATLRPYQLQGYFWMQQLALNNLGGVLADDMGLGKTLQTITLLQSAYFDDVAQENSANEGQLSLFDNNVVQGFNKSNLPPSLVVMPTSLVHNWLSEIKKFAPLLKVYNYTGQNRIRSNDIGKILRHYHLVVTSYGILRNDIDYFKSVPFYFVILDESQNIKNPTSKLYDVVMELNGQKRLALTGTPIENSLIDLWAQMNFVNPNILGTLNYFKNHFINPITKNQSQEHQARLQTLINPYILRRKKEEVATELPPITEQTLYCDMTPEQAKIYESEKSGIRNKLLNVIDEIGVEKTGIMALQALTRLRQLANHPVMVIDGYKGGSGKYNQIIENVENVVAEKHKVLIFSSFVKDLEIIEAELTQRKISYSKLTGSTNNRQEVIKQFKSNETCFVFLISLKAGGVGLNLTEADYVFMLNPWWNPAAEMQAISRAHRIGQSKNVFVYRFISTGTIEQKIAALQEKKQLLADTFINSNNPFKNLSESEIRELFA